MTAVEPRLGDGMRFSWKLAAPILCLWVLMISSAGGQIPTPPTAPPTPPIPAAPAAAPAPKTIWSFFCPPPGCFDKCKEKFCKSGIGKLMQAMMRPMVMGSGGLITPCCPTSDMPNPADLAKSAESADGAAARIKKEEMEAKERRANVKFLGTVDCNRYPEAEAALIKALRTDRNECVRWEAAMAFGNGCCCTKKTIDALILTATASEKDGNPVETSPRVLEAANYALAICQGRVPPQTPEPPEKAPLPELKKTPDLVQRTQPAPSRVWPVSFLKTTPAAPSNVGYPLPEVISQPETSGIPTGQRGLFQIFMRRAQPVSNERAQ